jgi:hypothetical protein
MNPTNNTTNNPPSPRLPSLPPGPAVGLSTQPHHGLRIILRDTPAVVVAQTQIALSLGVALFRLGSHVVQRFGI